MSLSASEPHVKDTPIGTLPLLLQTGHTIIEGEIVDAPPPTGSAESILYYVQNNQRSLVFDALARAGGYELAAVERAFRTRSDTALLVLCEDAGLNYAQSCVVLRTMAGVTRFRPIREDSKAIVRAYMRG